jgi:hypothetical protein
VVAITLAGFSLAPAGASSANISHAYHSSDTIARGSLVSLKADQADYIEPANLSNGARLLGIVVASDDSLLALDASSSKVQVATSGTATALVSDINGNISVGDQIAVSPFDGVGMKSEPGLHVVGIAQTDFKGNPSETAATKEVTDRAGHKKQIKLGYVRLNIGIAIDQDSGQSKLNGLQKLVKSLTGKTVSMVRIITALLITLVALVALVTLIYGAIYGSIISIGRNPLAKFAVFRTLGSVLTMAILTAAVAGFTIFFLLR